MNLLNNAFKFTPAGGDVCLRAVRDGDMLRIEVEDHCGGIPEIQRPIRSSRSPTAASTTAAASASGLSIARKAVRIYGGDISFRNLPDVGCVFTIELPLATDTPTPQTLPSQPAQTLEG